MCCQGTRRRRRQGGHGRGSLRTGRGRLKRGEGHEQGRTGATHEVKPDCTGLAEIQPKPSHNLTTRNQKADGSGTLEGLTETDGGELHEAPGCLDGLQRKRARLPCYRSREMSVRGQGKRAAHQEKRGPEDACTGDRREGVPCLRLLAQAWRR